MDVLVWFRSDLRVSDHPALSRAATLGAVLPVFVADPQDWAAPAASGRHWAFVAAALTELGEDLARLGAPLSLRQGAAAEVLPRLCRARGIRHIVSHRRAWTAPRDAALRRVLEAEGITWEELSEETPGLAPPERLTPVEGAVAGLIPPARSLGLKDDPCPFAQGGGRRAGLQLLESFVTGRGTQAPVGSLSPLAGERSSLRLSAFLTWGLLSQAELRAALPGALPPEVVKAVTARLNARRRAGQLEGGAQPAAPLTAALAAFSEGRSGLPFADALMRYLRATGWVNAHARSLLASVALHHLGAEFSATGQMLARLLSDYDPAIFWFQLQKVAAARPLDPLRAGETFDPEGRFIRRWCPELAAVPQAHLHRPWRWSGAGSVLGRRYPEPLADPQKALREAAALHRLRLRDETEFAVIEDPRPFLFSPRAPNAQLTLDL
ncbi:FAD-binding domain-containing protein [Falsigemmobacter faecalis]|uniref:Deoxyribodipyrimidine photolyase n=1 Tax=Falsigemmobacter faecalis TaxID=2488730 RepID=A0A3P3DTC4_9RHOB|nr:FAD-binding domain-containing protein [Falsigemmobacter faecalis]RRH77371.1 deoxyribodipyrimidine photolyase [Falsigemmobacter faecalis]